jgi:prolyl-tRNA editing enzyme YbaK/EbsC (Cys-tRNA(Pro) deacylase)
MSSASAVLASPSVERVRRALERAGLAEASDAPLLVMSSGAKRVSTALLAGLVGEAVAKADADFVRRHTGFAIGGVAPVGHGLQRVFIESSLRAYDVLWAAAGHPHTVFSLKYADLVRITGGTPAELAA